MKYKNNQNGYAILFTVVVISIILLISISLSDTTYKQMTLSALSKDSQTAFYQADTASECALLADYKGQVFNTEEGVKTLISNFSCGGQNMIVSGNDENDYVIRLDNENISGKCFNISVKRTQEDSVSPVITTVIANGYNICNILNIRSVERTIQVTY